MPMSACCRAGRALGAALVVLVLAACASLPKAGSAPGETFSGRLAVRVEASDAVAAHSLTAAFELQGDAQTGRLDLSTPLGNTLARATWTPHSVVLATPGSQKRYPDLDALTSDLLGESLPVAAMFDWLHGRPWPGASSIAVAPADQPGFEQLGWIVNLAQLDHGSISARRELPPPMTVRVKLDRP